MANAAPAHPPPPPPHAVVAYAQLNVQVQQQQQGGGIPQQQQVPEKPPVSLPTFILLHYKDPTKGIAKDKRSFVVTEAEMTNYKNACTMVNKDVGPAVSKTIKDTIPRDVVGAEVLKAKWEDVFDFDKRKKIAKAAYVKNGYTVPLVLGEGDPYVQGVARGLANIKKKYLRKAGKRAANAALKAIKDRAAAAKIQDEEAARLQAPPPPIAAVNSARIEALEAALAAKTSELQQRDVTITELKEQAEQAKEQAKTERDEERGAIADKLVEAFPVEIEIDDVADQKKILNAIDLMGKKFTASDDFIVDVGLACDRSGAKDKTRLEQIDFIESFADLKLTNEELRTTIMELKETIENLKEAEEDSEEDEDEDEAEEDSEEEDDDEENDDKEEDNDEPPRKNLRAEKPAAKA